MNKGLNENIESIAKMLFEDLKPLREIGKELGISAMGIQKALKRNGYDTSKLSLNITCDYCGIEFKRHRFRVRKNINNFCSEDCYIKWKNVMSEGSVIDRNGMAISRRKMEKFYGELPKGSIVHHIDGNDTNTLITNLMLLASQKDHFMVHRKVGNPVILFDGRKLIEVYPNLVKEDVDAMLRKLVGKFGI